MIRIKKYVLNLFIITTLIFTLVRSYSQGPLIRYSKDHPTAKVNYCHILGGIYKNYYDSLPSHPITGAYTSTAYALIGVKLGRGECNYICIPTNGKLKSGHQYHLRLTLWLDKDYALMPYFQNHFGFAVTTELPKNEWGLWNKHFIPFGLLPTEEKTTLELEFRPMIGSRYILIGVFQGREMDDYYLSDFSQHEFKLHSLEISASDDPAAPFHYVGDPFVEEELESKYSARIDSCSIYFESGSNELKTTYVPLIDSLALRLTSPESLVYLFGHTDISGEDNIKLGASRNESVAQALEHAGVDSSRIVKINFGESKASKTIKPYDRRVDIFLNMGKRHQKFYTEALEAAQSGDYGTAHMIMMKKWIRIVPPELAIYALFDCWGNDKKADRFKKNLYTTIKNSFYKNKELHFTFDSLYLEDKKNSNINPYFAMNRLPTYKGRCDYPFDQHRQKIIQNFAHEYITYHGFSNQNQVGKKGAILLEDIILQSSDPDYLKRFLPVVEDACTKGKLRWDYYARLYDKINVIANGFQKYGTLTYVDKDGKRLPQHPIWEVDSLAEFRRRVKLSPFSLKSITELTQVQNQIDTALVQSLNKVYQSDQNIRHQYKETEMLYGYDSEELKIIQSEMAYIDSVNLVEVENILTQHGWLSSNIIGTQGNLTLFLIIQHADIETQKKYLPLMIEASKKGNASPEDVAFLQDRILVRQGLPQKYGTQVLRDEGSGAYYIPEIENPSNVNKLRKEIGLQPIEVYLTRWNLKWDNH